MSRLRAALPYLIFAVVVALIVAGVVVTVNHRDMRATVTFTDGRVVHCEWGYWDGGGFGADNRFRCDGVDYTIQSILEVTRP